jgi:Mg-chelatase subunit ChlD
MVILLLLLLVGLLAAAAFSVDVAYMQLVRCELRRATDAAARAGGESLSRTDNVQFARQAAKSAAARNLVVGRPLVLEDQDILFGNTSQAEDGSWHFAKGVEPFNSVRIAGDLTSQSANGKVGLFFGKAIGTDYFEPTMAATVVEGESSKRDFCVVVDRSGSMNSKTGGTTRWGALLSAFGGFLQALGDTEDDEQVGLVSYSNSSTIDHRPTDQHGDPERRLLRIRPNGRTNIHSGIVDGTLVLRSSRDKAKRIMVVMTDGRHNRGPEPIRAALGAAKHDITIFTITFGGSADIKRMQKVANATGGKHYHAPTAADLQRIFRQVVTETEGLTFAE